MMVSDSFLGFLGFGHMAQVICKVIEQSRLLPRSQILFNQRDPDKARRNSQTFGISSTTLETLVERCDVIVIGVRPDQTERLMEQLKKVEVPPSKLLVTLVAGIRCEYYAKRLGENVPVLRLMPNMASELSQGMTLFSYNSAVTGEQKSTAHLIFSCMGPILEVSESLMDVSSAISGCGPAFVFRMIEAVARFGEKKGLSYEKALQLSAQTFLGASSLILKGNHPEELIRKIAVPNGMTEAGLKVMTEMQIDEKLQAVISSSAQKSKEFSQEYS